MPSSPAYEDDFEDYEDDFEDDEPSPAASAAAAPPPSPPAAAAVKPPQIAAPAAAAASPTVESPPMKHQHSSFALITLDELDVADTLAAGAMGTVCAGVWRGQPVAVKTLHDTSAAQLAAVEQELLVHAALSEHRGVVRLLGANLAPPGCCIVMERCRCSLFARLHGESQALDRRHTVDLALEIAEAMAFLHSRTPPIVHRDLKSHNVLLADDGSARLCDFGLVNTKTVTAGTPNYMAPELFAGKTWGMGVDVFAFGVLVNEMFARELPWDGLQPLDIKEKVASGERPRKASTMPSACEGLVRRMWHQTASIRPSFAQAIESLKTIQESLPLARSSHREVSRRFADAADEFAALGLNKTF